MLGLNASSVVGGQDERKGNVIKVGVMLENPKTFLTI
jgi:hypothetical protein